MRGYSAKEEARLTAGPVAALVITGWLVVLAIAFLCARQSTGGHACKRQKFSVVRVAASFHRGAFRQGEFRPF
jgi:hypothetical protein